MFSKMEIANLVKSEGHLVPFLILTRVSDNDLVMFCQLFSDLRCNRELVRERLLRILEKMKFDELIRARKLLTNWNVDDKIFSLLCYHSGTSSCRIVPESNYINSRVVMLYVEANLCLGFFRKFAEKITRRKFPQRSSPFVFVDENMKIKKLIMYGSDTILGIQIPDNKSDLVRIILIGPGRTMFEVNISYNDMCEVCFFDKQVPELLTRRRNEQLNQVYYGLMKLKCKLCIPGVRRLVWNNLILDKEGDTQRIECLRRYVSKIEIRSNILDFTELF